MTDAERYIMDSACAIVRQAGTGLLLIRGPQKLDVQAVYCHPSDEAGVREMYDAPIVVDPTQKPGTIGIVPFAYAKNITATIGFVNPGDAAKDANR